VTGDLGTRGYAIVTATTLAAAFATLACLVFYFIAHPAGAAARLAQINQELTSAEQLTAEEAGMSYPANAVCHQSIASAAAALKLRLQQVSNLNVTHLEVSADRARHAADLMPITFSMEATGQPEAAVGFLVDLSRAQPKVFVDQADLQSTAPLMGLKLSGRIYCSNTSRP